MDYKKLTEHLFRVEYGKIVAVIGKFLGVSNLQYAEDIAQETFSTAVSSWQHRGVPPNPQAWLYTVAKNKCINWLKREKLKRLMGDQLLQQRAGQSTALELNFSDDAISDDQLRMMFVCCHPSISPKAQIALMLKVLCGFSISEIANAFFSSPETTKKRLSRARKKLRENSLKVEGYAVHGKDISVVLQAIYLLFNEGYSPAVKNKVLRKELCFEAIRLCEILKDNPNVADKSQCFALLSLMFLNVSRFEARNAASDEIIEMQNQDRSLWNQELIHLGFEYLNKTFDAEAISSYHILAAISAHHCTALNFENTNWSEILNLYDQLIQIDDSPIVKLNRSVAVANASGYSAAILELKTLSAHSDIKEHYLFHATIAEFYKKEHDNAQARKHLDLAIKKASNLRDIDILRKKMAKVVPV